MDKNEQELQKRLLATFRIEAAEHIQLFSANLIELERPIAQESKIKIIETIYRGAHSLKGAARAVGITDIEAVCQALENVLSGLKRAAIQLTPALLDTLHDTADFLNKSLFSATDNLASKNKLSIAPIIRRLENAEKQNQPISNGQAQQTDLVNSESFRVEEIKDERSILSDTVRISTARLDALLFQSEGLITAKQASFQTTSDICDVSMMLAQLKKERAKVGGGIKAIHHAINEDKKNVDPEKIQHELRKLSDAFAHETEMFRSFQNRFSELMKAIEINHRSLSGMVDGMMDDMKKALMLPINSVLNMCPKLVRDLAKDQGKEISLDIKGSEIEVDRRILEEIRDPLVHLIRNSIYHGIELPDVRERKGKLRAGKIGIFITQQSGGKIDITITDNGAGIDLIKVKQAANKLGMSDTEVTLDSETILALIFNSGLSTSNMITDISGRGLGLAIVKENVEKLGGSITVDTQTDVGTSFHMTLPLTLATFRGVHIQVNEQRFVIPATQVEEVLRIKMNAIRTIENRETIELRNEVIALVRLTDVLGLPRLQTKANDYSQAVILGIKNKKIAFLVDEVIDEQEILVKNLGKQLSRVRNIAGATVSGTGKAVPILDVKDLLASAVKLVTNPMVKTKIEGSSSKGKSVLVAEDSITSRAMLKNILESAGYTVATASDGVDAYSLLKTKHFDLTISDVEMPRMSGFDLTSKIREDIDLKNLPVILVTGLASREHQERGIDVGANAYIIKSSFDQSNLLDVVRRLI